MGITESKLAEKVLRDCDEKYLTLFNSIDEGFCIIEVLFDPQGKPADYRFLVTNAAFENQTGLYNACGRRIRALAPDNEEYWFEIYGKIALTGKSVRFENEAKALNRWYDVYAFHIGERHENKVAILFNDISCRKKAEVEKKRYIDFERTILNLSQDFINKPLNDLDAAIHQALHLVGEFCGVDRSSIYKYDWGNEVFTRLYGWDRELLRPTGKQWDVVPFSKIPDIIDCHKKGVPYIVNSIEDVPTNNICYNTIAERNTQAAATFPLAINGNLWGALGFSTIRKQKTWTESEVSIMKAFCEFLIGVIRRKERVKALQEANESNRLILDSTIDGIGMLDRDGKILNINEKFARRLNKTVEETIGMNFKELLPEEKFGDLYEKRLQRIHNVFDSGLPEIFEDSRNGTYFYNRFYPIFNNEQVSSVTLFSTDITDRKKAEAQAQLNAVLRREAETLREKEKEYLEILDGSTEATWIYDFGSKTLEYSSEWLKRISGENISPQDMDKYIKGLVHPADVERIMQERREIIGSKLPKYKAEYRLLTVDRGYIWVFDRAKIIYNENGTPAKIFGTSMDITDRKKAEESLRESEAKYRLLFDSIDEGFCTIEVIFDGAGHPVNLRYIDYNPAFEKQTGVTDIKGKLHRDILPGSEDNWFKIFGHVALTGEPVRFTNEATQLNRWYDLFAFKIGDHDSRIISVLFNDITQRRKSEEALRTSEEELKKADKNKNEFLNALSHELRNPLAVIVTGLSLMSLTDDKQKNTQTSEIIHRQVNQLCHLVDELLDLTRITNNKIELKKERIELINLASTVVDDFHLLFGKKGINLEVNLSKQRVFLDADPVRIKQIIGNLLQNAMKFTNAGGSVIITVFEDSKDAIICVKDNGIGIKPEFLPCLFEPFKQSNTSIDRSDGGLGLGLSIVKGIAELHGGSVRAYSEGPGKGSEFTICLPIHI